MNRTLRTTAIGGLLSAVFLLPQGSAATWTDTETAATQFATTTLPAPTFDSCSNTAGDITVTWHYATTTTTLTAGNVQWSASNGVLQQLTNIITPSSTTTTGPTNGRYQTTITAGAISNLASLSSFTIQAQTVLANWTTISTNSAQGVSTGLIGIGVYTCTLN
ncbi:hypothetical protein KZI27_00155 (plasmid) [Curtobacterium sp. TC1]|uniref:hypothetical protein n=1 Tax=Curtobacterium sp. TC1 TaxID=2862880 RepID=UPI001C9AF2E1|nr:hypothetical protein [Curtobacterium sp. TC1]QZQ53688.1 hypothetical protein KZI27_00155 [Curtobacterium sp. TC1]